MFRRCPRLVITRQGGLQVPLGVFSGASPRPTTAALAAAIIAVFGQAESEATGKPGMYREPSFT